MTFHGFLYDITLAIVFPAIALFYAPFIVIRFSRTHPKASYGVLVIEGIVCYYLFMFHHECSLDPIPVYFLVGFLEIFVFGLWVLLANWRKLSKTGIILFFILYFSFFVPGLFILRSYYLHITTSPVISRYHMAWSNIENIALSIEIYHTDHKRFLPAVDEDGEIIPFSSVRNSVSDGYLPWMLTTPMAYFGPIRHDTFAGVDEKGWARTFRYATDGMTGYILASRGPDRDFDMDLAAYIADASCDITRYLTQFRGTQVEYDPTNGGLSSGDVFRTGP